MTRLRPTIILASLYRVSSTSIIDSGLILAQQPALSILQMVVSNGTFAWS